VKAETGRLQVSMTLTDTFKENGEFSTEVILDPSDGLVGFRKDFLDWLKLCGLPMTERQQNRVLWPEITSLTALGTLGRSVESYYLFALGEGRFDEGLLDQAVQEAPESYLAHDFRAWARLKIKDFDAAEKGFRDALKVNPEGVGAVSGLMWCAVYARDEQRAFALGEEKAGLRGDDPVVERASVANRLGNAANGAGDYHRAADLYQKARTLNPEKRLYATKSARALGKTGRFEEGLKILDQGLLRFKGQKDRKALLGEKADLLLQYGKYLRGQGHYPEARRHLESVIKSDPHGPYGKAAAQELEKMAR
jgi:tetratricopeptide (TPR) repeat protein